MRFTPQKVQRSAQPSGSKIQPGTQRFSERCVGCNKTMVFYILFAPNRWHLPCCFGVKCTARAQNNVISSGIICITCIKRGPFSPPGKPVWKEPTSGKDWSARTAPGWIYGFHFNDRGDGPQKLLSWRVGFRQNPQTLGNFTFLLWGDEPKLLEFAPFCFWRWT